MGDLKNAINGKPDVKYDSGNTDLDITDTEGYVLARFSNGHIQTKNFDSGSSPAIRSTTASDIPLDITDSEGYVILRLANGHIHTKNFDSSVQSVGFEYKFSGNDLLIGYGCNETDDYVVVMNRGRANNLFDFSKLCTKAKGTSLKNLDTGDLTVVWNSGTDMHGPFQFNAVNNADGYHYDATDAGFVGGNHTLDQLGTGFETAESVYVKYYADGVPVSSGYGRATNFGIRWANDVQAYNTVKQGGGGRACLREYHEMIFDGVQFNEIVKIVPLEDINMRLWYGFQFVSWGTIYTNIRFIDGQNRTVYPSTQGNVNSGKLDTKGMEAFGDNDKIILMVDTEFDLGKRDLVATSYTDGAFTSNSKGYFRIITKGSTFVMEENDAYYLKGSFRFMPNISVT